MCIHKLLSTIPCTTWCTIQPLTLLEMLFLYTKRVMGWGTNKEIILMGN